MENLCIRNGLVCFLYKIDTNVVIYRVITESMTLYYKLLHLASVVLLYVFSVHDNIT